MRKPGSRAQSLAGIMMLALAGVEQAWAAAPVVFWWGTASDQWSGNNWSTNNTTFLSYTPQNGDTLKWSTSSINCKTSNNDRVGLTAGAITLQGATGPIELNGNELTLTGTINSYSVTSTFNLPLKLGAGVGVFTPGAAGNQTFNGVISETGGARGLTLTTGTITLNATNTHSGNTIVGGGTGETIVYINTLATNGVAQSLGRGGSVQFGQDGNGTVVYTGGATRTDKGFQIGKSAAASTTDGGFHNEGSGAVVWAGPQTKAINNAQTLMLKLGGSNTNNNEWQSMIADNSSALSGRIGVAKVGTGKWILSGTNTYTGPTAVSNGTLWVNGLLGGAGSNVTVFKGATLGGTGIINRAVTVNSGGALAPGASVGALTVTGAVTLAENAIYKWEYRDGAGDLVAVKGALTLPNAATVIVSQVSGSLPTTPTLFTFNSRGDANTTDAWVVQGLSGYKTEVKGNSVVLTAGARGTVVVLEALPGLAWEIPLVDVDCAA